MEITDKMVRRGARAMASEYERGHAPDLDAFVRRVDETWGRYTREVRIILEAALASDTGGRE